MNKRHDKIMTDLHRMLETQTFNSEEELAQFLESIRGKTIPSFPKEALSPQEQAQDLVFEAYEADPPKAMHLIEEALLLDFECIEAFEFLGQTVGSPVVARVFFEKGIALGRQKFGGNYRIKNKGHFWGRTETRPFMRCMHLCAECLHAMGKVRESVALLEELVDLNPNDNQGVRDTLTLYLIQLNEDKKFIKYAKMFSWDDMAFARFNRALFSFKQEGETELSNAQLADALKQNKFVAKLLLSDKPIRSLAGYHGRGDKNEAEYYVSYARPVWAGIAGAREWLRKHSGKPTKR